MGKKSKRENIFKFDFNNIGFQFGMLIGMIFPLISLLPFFVGLREIGEGLATFAIIPYLIFFIPLFILNGGFNNWLNIGVFIYIPCFFGGVYCYGIIGKALLKDYSKKIVDKNKTLRILKLCIIILFSLILLSMVLFYFYSEGLIFQ